MALPRKTSRRIVVDNLNYRWTTTDSHGPNSKINNGAIAFALTLIVEAEGNVNSRIYASAEFQKIVGKWDSWFYGYQDDSLIHPRHVAAVVSAAINDNWKPDLGSHYYSEILFGLLLEEFPSELASLLTK